MLNIRVKRSVYNEVIDWANRGHKINAIKVLREHTMCGLREAKDAIEYEVENKHGGTAKMLVTSDWKIESITVTDVGTGNRMKLSVSDLELKFLQEMHTIGLDAVADLLNLTEYLKKWQSDLNS
jgi:DNA polymerase/3'-5' exonuclease PolX